MTKVFYTFKHTDNDCVYQLTTEDLRLAQRALDLDDSDLADLLTGYNCDSYADAVEDLATSYETVEEAQEFDAETYDRVLAYYRILNLHQADELIQEGWLADWKATAEG